MNSVAFLFCVTKIISSFMIDKNGHDFKNRGLETVRLNHTFSENLNKLFIPIGLYLDFWNAVNLSEEVFSKFC